LNTVPTGRLCDTEAEKKARLRRGSKLTMVLGTSQPEILHYMACRLEKETN
jgi:hypothetical protein